MPRHWWIAFLACSVLTGIEAYSQEPSPRSYRMGTQPFFMRPAPAPYPDWRFENLEDKDLLSIHLDEHMGIPWDHFQKNQAPPAIWDRRVRDLAQRARATGKVIYLSANPLDGFRRKRAGLVNENGVKNDNASPRDRHGCHPFADDEPSRAMREAYVRYSRYLIDLFQPAYFSPAVEINAYFSECPERKEALIQWYSQLHHDLKAVYPNLPVFPTIQMEHLYGMASDKAWCGGTKTPERLAACLDRHLKEAMRLPGDVTGISVYPVGWLYLSPTGIPWTSMFDKISQASARPIFIAETGWASVPIRQGYKYRTGGSCKSGWIIDPSTANDKVAGDYLRALLAVADRYPIEAVVWWLNRDYFDAPVAEACPCEGENDTCTTLGQLHRVMRGADTLFRSS